MSFGSSHDAKEQVRQAIDIADLIGEYVQLRRQGSGYVALCPWHDDSRPSLQVNPTRQSWKCWVCDVGGDIFSWTMKQEGVEFPEALRMLADRAGISIARPGGHQTAAGEAVEDERRALFQTMAWAEEQYHDFLVRADEAEVARRYLRERGITDDSLHRFHLGFAPDRRDWITNRARQADVSVERLEKVGVLGRSQERGDLYERFRGRVLFSIRDAQGRPVGMGGRLLPELNLSSPAKYVNSPETPLFSKSHLLYGMDVSRQGIQRTKMVLVTEGYTDCIAAHQAGFDNTVAVLGTALGERHTKLLRRVSDRVVLILDGDDAGQRRSNEVLELFLAEQLDLRIATLPEGLDPSDFLQQRGADAFREFVEQAPDALDFKFQTAFSSVGAAGSIHQTSEAVDEILRSLARVGTSAVASSTAAALKEDQILYRLGRRAGVSEDRLRARLADLRKSTRRSAPQVAPIASEAVPPTLNFWESELFEVLLQRPAAFAELREVVDVDEHLPSPAAKLLFSLTSGLADDGETFDFDRLMLELESPVLKSLLVDLDERGRAKDAQTLDERVRDVVAGFRQRTAQSKNRAQTVALGEHGVAEDEELKILQEIFEQERKRHGISVPTDG
ncbi:MAG: DNA primase [Pirellulales bacterium]|nr:DNA primase [Pirellulales bacterium]